MAIDVFNKDDLLLYSFENLAKTAAFFKISSSKIKYRLETGKPLILEQKEYFIKRSVTFN